ncbi:MAG: sugar ABC transporter permease [Treponema sp.]|nr:sugar ABC transporter permease [Treponema sp.]
MNYRKAKQASYYSFVLPAFVLYALVLVVPVLFSVGLGFFRWRGYDSPEFIGLGNYVRMLGDGVFHIALRNNLLVVLVSVLGQVPLGMFLAYILHRKMTRWPGFFKAMIFLPITVSSVIIAQLWNQIFSPVGLFPSMVRAISGNPDYIMTIVENRTFAMVPIMFVLLWQHTSLYMVIFLANMQRIPNSLIEAAKLDGASEGQVFLRVVAPMQGYVIFINSVLAISGSFKSFDLVFSMTRGGPANFTELIAIYMYNSTFVHQNYGFGSALAVVIVLFCVVSVLAARAISNKLSME